MGSRHLCLGAPCPQPCAVPTAVSEVGTVVPLQRGTRPGELLGRGRDGQERPCVMGGLRGLPLCGV